MPVEPDLLPDEPSRAAAACSLLVLKVMSKPSLSAVGGSGSTEGGEEEAMYTQTTTHNNSRIK